MAYETGTASDIDEIINTKLKSFAVAEGWSNNDDNWPNFLALSKGDCFVNFRRNSPVTFNDAFGVSRTDNRLRAHLATGYDGSGGSADDRYTSQPNSLVSSVGDTDEISMNDLTGPFTSYHLFSGGAGDRPYIVLVAESTAGFFSHLCFGEVDILEAFYAPVPTFLAATFYAWWPTSATEAVDSMVHWDGNDHDIPFDTFDSAVHLAPGNAGAAGAAKMLRSNVFPNHRRLGLLSDAFGSSGGRYADSHFVLGPNPLNGVTPFLPVLAAGKLLASSNTEFAMGALPNIRWCSMKGRAPKEEITIGSDTWMVFPLRRQKTEYTIPRPASPAIDNTSGQAGIAYKKIAA